MYICGVMTNKNIKPNLHTVLTPQLLDLYEIKDSIVVIIDVFRATSTMATALYNGARKIIPVDSPELCIEMGKQTGGVTAGERDGKIIPGLSYGNSPSEYPRSFIENKVLVITTTNGTKPPIAVSDVNTIGTNLTSPASRIASSSPKPSSRS